MAKQRRTRISSSKCGRRTAASSRKRTSGRRAGARKWSARVTRESNALDLEKGVFKLDSPRRIAASLKRSAERSRRRKANAYRSALSMLTSTSTAPVATCRRSGGGPLDQAKVELKAQFGRA